MHFQKGLKNQRENQIFGPGVAPKMRRDGPRTAERPLLAALGRFCLLLGRSWVTRGPHLAALGLLLASLGRILATLARLLAGLGPLLGAMWGAFVVLWAAPGGTPMGERNQGLLGSPKSHPGVS